MTVVEAQPDLDGAIAVIDEYLSKMMKRDLVSSGEVTDFLLDLRNKIKGSGILATAGVETQTVQ